MPIKEDEVSFTYDLEDLLNEVPEDEREDAALEAGEIALQKVHEYMDKRVSPVNRKGRFEALAKGPYRKFKKSKVGNTKANLRLTGELIESMEVDADDRSFTISVGGDENNIAKSYNHLVGDTVAQRQFLPNDDIPNQTFKRGIVKAIKDTIKKYQVADLGKPSVKAPPETISVNFNNLLSTFKATKREQQIAKNVKTFKIEDLL